MRSVNQNHHLYVVKSVSSDDVTEASDLGAIKAYVCGDNVMDRDLYFKYKGHDGVVRSDFIPLNQVAYIKFVSAASQTTKLKKVEITINSAALDSGNLIVGKDYILNIEFQQFYGLSPEDTYVKTVGVHVTNATKAVDDFLDAMVDELNASFSREVGANATSNPYLTFTADKTNDKLIITEKEQPWSLGKWEAESLMFNVFTSTIYVGGDDVEWGTVTKGVSNTVIPNSKRMADLEWFTFKERADIYGGMGYPNNFDFVPIVNPNSTDGYDALEIHFAYQGTCEDIQKSEKDITLIASAASSGTLINSIAAQIEALVGNKVNDGEPLTKVATPVISYDSSTHKATVTCSTPGNTMRYTTNGTAPAAVTDGTAVSGEITLTSGQTLKVVGFKDGLNPSDTASQAYS